MAGLVEHVYLLDRQDVSDLRWQREKFIVANSKFSEPRQLGDLSGQLQTMELA